MEDAGFVTYTAAGHQWAILLHFWRAVMSVHLYSKSTLQLGGFCFSWTEPGTPLIFLSLHM